MGMSFQWCLAIFCAKSLVMTDTFSLTDLLDKVAVFRFFSEEDRLGLGLH